MTWVKQAPGVYVSGDYRIEKRQRWSNRLRGSAQGLGVVSSAWDLYHMGDLMYSCEMLRMAKLQADNLEKEAQCPPS